MLLLRLLQPLPLPCPYCKFFPPYRNTQKNNKKIYRHTIISYYYGKKRNLCTKGKFWRSQSYVVFADVNHIFRMFRTPLTRTHAVLDSDNRQRQRRRPRSVGAQSTWIGGAAVGGLSRALTILIGLQFTKPRSTRILSISPQQYCTCTDFNSTKLSYFPRDFIFDDRGPTPVIDERGLIRFRYKRGLIRCLIEMANEILSSNSLST